MSKQAQQKIDSLSQAERILFGTYCRLINQVLYPEESEDKKLQVEDLDGLFQSLSDAVNPVNLYRIIDLVIDVAADLLGEEKAEESTSIETDFLVAKAEYFSKYLWEYDVLGSISEIAKDFFSDFESFLRARARE